jgi:hypothetical protein
MYVRQIYAQDVHWYDRWIGFGIERLIFNSPLSSPLTIPLIRLFAVRNRCSRVGLGIFRFYLDSIAGKAPRFDCGSNESGMKLQFILAFAKVEIIKKNFAPAFPLTCSSVCVQLTKQLRSQTPLRTTIRQKSAQDVHWWIGFGIERLIFNSPLSSPSAIPLLRL